MHLFDSPENLVEQKIRDIAIFFGQNYILLTWPNPVQAFLFADLEYILVLNGVRISLFSSAVFISFVSFLLEHYSTIKWIGNGPYLLLIAIVRT